MCKGFTLAELVMVLTILAILAVVAYPRMMDLPAMRIELAARKMQSDIRYAQSLAISIQKRTRINFRAAQDDYSVYIEDGAWVLATDPLTKENFTVQLNVGEFTGVEIESVYFNEYDQALVFDQWGNPYGYNIGTGQATALDNPAGVRITGLKDIVIERGTGRVYIQ